MIDEKKTLTKQDMIEAVIERLGITKAEAGTLIEHIFDTLKAAMQTEDKVKISGFGYFIMREKKARVGRNPQTGATLEISARRVVTFHASEVLRAQVNGSSETT